MGIDSDSIGHEVLTDPHVVRFVVSRWPSVVDRGVVDRSRLGELVFSDRDELDRLEAITHPLILARIATQAGAAESPPVVELPLVKHNLGDEWITVVVDSPLELRLQRLESRGMSEEDALARIHSQPSRAVWLSVADAVVPNTGSLDELVAGVERLRLGLDL